jgi:hypothetical protein
MGKVMEDIQMFVKGKWYKNNAGDNCYVLRDDNTTFADKLPLVVVMRLPANRHHDWDWITLDHQGLALLSNGKTCYDLIPGEIEAPVLDVALPDERSYVQHA